MIDLTFEVRGLKALTSEFYPAHQRALRRAVQGEAFRLMHKVTAKLAQGVGPVKAPLTRRAAKSRQRGALSAFARRVAYEVRVTPGAPPLVPDQIEAAIGLSAQQRRRQAPMPLELLARVVEGEGFTMSRGAQIRLIEKLRRRGRSEAEIRRIVPRVGTVIEFPERDYVSEVIAEEGAQSLRNIEKLYAMGLSGERWARKWWED